MIDTLKAAHYTQGDAFQAEKQHLFAVSWVPRGAAAQLEAPGDFVSANIGGWPVFAVRGEDGVVRALINSCRHKKMLLVEQAHGRCALFRCRYHGWTYGLDGRFRDAPPPVAPADPASDEHHLPPLRVAIAHGMVFVNLNPRAADGDFSALAGGATHDYYGAVTTDIGCNWKARLEHALTGDAAASWQWPLLLAYTVGEVHVVEQIVPRTFLRTRLIAHVYGAPGVAGVDSMDKAAALATVTAHAGEQASACEALQAARAGGVTCSGENAALGALHEKVLAAYALARA
jgi:nitrite reductase/ring-hydroxylating ferredoxin subunit